MNNEDFIDMERQAKNSVEEFKVACEKFGVDFFDRVADIVFDLTGKDLEHD